jgi:hypothetical protein
MAKVFSKLDIIAQNSENSIKTCFVSNVKEFTKYMTTLTDYDLATQSLQIKEIQEIAITIAAKNLNPTLLTEEFLKFSGIVPEDWELAKQPIVSPGGAQVSFQNGVSIVAQPRTISFIEGIGNKTKQELQIPEIAQQYVQKLPKAEFQNLTINPKSIIPLLESPDSARKYITQTLLSPGSWQNLGNAPLQAGINLLYQLDNRQLSISINEANLQLPDGKTLSALLFAGSFNYGIEGATSQERLDRLQKAINNWQIDLETFQEIVSQRFLPQQIHESVFFQS